MAVRKVYKSVVGTRREEDQKVAPRRCEHTHHTPEAAQACLVTRVREAVRTTPLIELVAKVEYSHSRHDWFPL